jgi:putative DNA primase/helicase
MEYGKDVIYGNIPDELKTPDQWVCWRYKKTKDGKTTKMPIDAKTGKAADTTNSENWSSFDDARNRFEQRKEIAGIGFVFSEDDPYVGIDLDTCRNPETGEIAPWAQEFIDMSGTYSEVSPSGTGGKMFLKGKMPSEKGRKRAYETGAVEIYEHSRFFTITGGKLGRTMEINHNTDAINMIYTKVFGNSDDEAKKKPPPEPSEPVTDDDQALIDKAMKAANGSKFTALWQGNWEAAGYTSQSEADLALCFMLAFWTQGDAARMDSLFRQSGLMRDKWDREDYRAATINKALAQTQYYDPNYQDQSSKQVEDNTNTLQQNENPNQSPQNGSGANQQMSASDAFLLLESADDEGNAQCVHQLYGSRLLHCDAYGYTFWNKHYWCGENAEAKLHSAIVQTLKRRRVVAVNAENEAIVRCSKPTARRVKDCKFMFQRLVTVSTSEFDNDPDVLNCHNGVVNLKTGELIAHEPSQRFTYCLPVEYDSNADQTKWRNFLHQVVGGGEDVTEYIQTASGYSATGRTSEECMWYVFGPTRSGKGAFTETMLALFPRPLAVEADFTTFTAQRDGDANNFDLAPLKPARIVIASESRKYQTLNESKIKQLTGGNLIRCAFKHKTHFEYQPQFKIWLVSNYPVNADPDDAPIWHRLRLIEFPKSFAGCEDKTLKQRLRSPENLRGVLAWVLEGSQRWYSLGSQGLKTPPSVIDAVKKQRTALDTVQAWIDECSRQAPDHWNSNAEVRTSYETWCKDNGVEPKGLKSLMMSLRQKGYKIGEQKWYERKNQRGVIGLNIIDSEVEGLEINDFEQGVI